MTPVSRRRVVGYLGAGAAALGIRKHAAQRSVHALEMTWQTGSSGPDSAHLETLDELVEHYRRTFRGTPPAELYEEISGVRGHVGSLLGAAPTSRSRSTDLVVTAGWLSNLLALVTHDLGDRASALVWCADAERQGRQVGHPELAGWAAHTRVLMSFYEGQARQAIAHAQRGQNYAVLGTVAHAELAAQEMRAWALLRDSEMVARTRSRAAHAIAKLPADVPTHDAFTINLADDPPYTATSLLLLGQFREAAEATRRVAETYYSGHDGVNRHPSGFARTHLILALALAGLGELSEAHAAATSALNTPRMVWGAGVLAGRVDGVLSRDFPGTVEARDYHEQYLNVIRPSTLAVTGNQPDHAS